jgi:hypothetical protein
MISDKPGYEFCVYLADRVTTALNSMASSGAIWMW